MSDPAPLALPIASPMSMNEPPTHERGGRPLLFCPFCKECFEGETVCPEHELALVPFDALPREDDRGAIPAHDEPIGLLDPRFGRGLVMLGVALSIVGFVMPVLSVVTDTRSQIWSGFEAATGRAPNLWTIPFVAATFVWMLARRRTPIAMRGARLAGIVFALAPLVSLAYTVTKVRAGAAEQAAASGRALSIGVEAGVWVIAAASLLCLAGSAVLGVLPRAKDETSARLRPR
jgi:hypothetical protein